MPRQKTITWAHLGGGNRTAKTEHYAGGIRRSSRDTVSGLQTYICDVTERHGLRLAAGPERIIGLRDAIAWVKHNLRRLEEAKTIATNSRPNPLPGREARP